MSYVSVSEQHLMILLLSSLYAGEVPIIQIGKDGGSQDSNNLLLATQS